MARAAPRTSSSDSTLSSISAGNQPNFAQDATESPETANLIAAAGSAEAVISYLLKEKKSQAAQNSQLWRLVDKQRAMILGLNKDLERALKEKERYRRKTKEILAQSSTNSIPPKNPPGAQISSSGHQDPLTNELDLPKTISEPKNQQEKLPDTDLGSAVELKIDDSEWLTLSSPTLSTQHSRILANRRLSSIEKSPNVSHIPVNDSETRGQASKMSSTLPLNFPWRKLPPLKVDTTSLAQSKKLMKDVTELRRFTLPSHNVPTALLSMKNLENPSYEVLVTPSLTDIESDKEDILTYRGRRKTREEDEIARAIISRRCSEIISPCPLISLSKPLAASSTELKSSVQNTVSSPSKKTRIMIGLSIHDSQLLPSPKVRNVTVENPRNSSHSSGRSLYTLPGLPSSPRPVRNNVASPSFCGPGTSSTNSASSNSSPWSNRGSTLLDVDQLSGEDLIIEKTPKSQRQIPSQGNDSPLSILEPYSQGLQLKSPTPLVINKKLFNNKSEKDDEVKLLDSPNLLRDGIYRGLVSDEFPDLLVSPSALSLVEVKVASSRLKSSRASMMFPRSNEEEPVFTLAIFGRSSRRELWRVEKDLSSLSLLDHNLKLSSQITVKIPDKSLFSGHAPAKLDARRSALDDYFKRVFECELSITPAMELCRYLSSNVLEAYAEDIAPHPVNEKSQSGLVKKSPEAQPVKKGYLTKRGKNFGGWKSRYFELSGPILKYYESPGGPHLGAIKLQQAQIGKQSQPTDKASQTGSNGDASDRMYRHAFLILEPKRKDSSTLVRHVLCAESDAERDQWVDALCQYINYKKPDKNNTTSKSQIEPSNSKSSRHTNDSKPNKKNSSQKKQVQQDLSEESLRGVSYEETKVGQRPLLGRKGTSNRTSSPKGSIERDSPTPNINSTPTSQTQPTKTNPINKNGQTLQDLNAKINRQNFAPPIADDRIKQKKKSFFGFGNKVKVPTDLVDAGIIENIPNIPEKALRPHGPMKNAFGAPLADAVKFNHPAGVKAELPAVVYRCIEYLNEKNATNEEGIFRLSGSNVIIRQLKERFNVEGDVNLVKDEQYYDVHAVASLLKLYLRELPTTILTSEYHLAFLAVTELLDINQKVDALNELVKKLPRENKALLQYLASFLIKIINNSDINKMTARNVGIVFSPTLNIPASVFALFLQQYTEIFNEQPSYQINQIERINSDGTRISVVPGNGYSAPRQSSLALKNTRQISAMDVNIPLPAYYKTNVEPTKVAMQSNKLNNQPSTPSISKLTSSNPLGNPKKRESSMFSMNMVSLSQRRTSMSKPRQIRLIDTQPVLQS